MKYEHFHFHHSLLNYTEIWLYKVISQWNTNCISTESCVGNCGSFSKQRKCQCDPLCVYYGSCCSDFDTVCPKKSQYRSRISSFIMYCVHFSESSLASSSCNSNDSALSCSWWHLPRSGSDRNSDDSYSEHCNGSNNFQHICSPHPCLSSTFHHSRALITPCAPWCSPLQRSTIWCFSAAEEWFNLCI